MKKFLWLIIVLAIFVVFSCGTEDSKPSDQTDVELPEKLPDQIITQFRLTETVEGEKKWELLARSASIYEEEKEIVVDSVYIDFYKNGEHYSTLTADKGIIYQKTNNMEAIGNVVIITDKGETLETEKIEWDSKYNRIFSDKFVKLTKGNDVLTGVGFETDPNLNRVKIKENVKAYVKDSVDSL